MKVKTKKCYAKQIFNIIPMILKCNTRFHKHFSFMNYRKKLDVIPQILTKFDIHALDNDSSPNDFSFFVFKKY